MADRVAWVNLVVAGRARGSGIDVLIDVSQITTMPEAEECGHIVRLMEKLQQHLGGRVAIVNARAGHATTSHLIAAHAASGEIRAFTDKTRARNWLASGVD
ncbi:STAS/SEC14 domain-containing protein [Horticoccus sp. 23ND18S-11]|uniref:STAS/SEC14 domain-containing protein n=1 Tax=Horticoccus sp. 23ND18S-11 TaxID=3391832 RepID=UPI0039C90C93